MRRPTALLLSIATAFLFFFGVSSATACHQHKDKRKAVGPAIRDQNGQILRSRAVIREFQRMTGFSNGRDGWVVDYIVPLSCGGKDALANLQWQMVEEAKKKESAE